MSKIESADLTDQVFENRNKEYGAYQIRKSYWWVLIVAAVIAYLLYLLSFGAPMIWNAIFPDKVVQEESIRFIDDLTLLDEPPPINELEEEVPPPPPPPTIKLKPPQIETIEFKVPVPDEEVEEEETIREMEEIEESTPGLEDQEGDEGAYDFDAEEGTGENTVVEEPKDPDPNAFIMVEKEPQAVNLDDIKGMIGYPPTAREAGIEGKVIVRVLVGKTGKYEKHILVRKAHPLLNKAVEDKINNLSFTPGIQAGKPIKVWVTIPFDFKLTK